MNDQEWIVFNSVGTFCVCKLVHVVYQGIYLDILNVNLRDILG